jgi:hypothetical protein
VPEFDSQDWDELALAYIALVFQYRTCSDKQSAAVQSYAEPASFPDLKIR